MNCPICNHKHRDKIEKEIKAMQFSDGDDTKDLHKIAETYKVKYNDLLIHMVMHISTEDEREIIQVNGSNPEARNESLASTIKRKEADILQYTLEEQTATFKNLSVKLNSIIAKHTDDEPTLQQITKPVVELYLGAGQAIRATVDSIAKLNLTVNGEKNEGVASLAGLVQVLRGGN